MRYTLLLVLIRMVDIINLCRNTSDGVRPLIPPCSLVSLYALTKISYLCLPSFMFVYFALYLRIRIWYLLIFYRIVCKKASEYFGCKLFTIIMHYLLSLRIGHILAVFFLIFLYYRKKQDMLDNLMRITVMWNSGETIYNSFP